ncbi:uncharacterized protein LOC113745374, partial [Larimichthys crocea]|uniref:uncharacterized protein LOC113745374 n=1 Tax=Larimichthys crocea TaxID=215358 RepID=UPI000F5E3699
YKCGDANSVLKLYLQGTSRKKHKLCAVYWILGNLPPAQLGDIKKQEVKSGAFQLRSKESHQLHIRTAQEEKVNCFGVKRSCILTDSLSHFNVLSGYPPDIVHDLFEGIVPVELARCIAVLLSKKYFTLDHINNVIRLFPYKWGDKTNCPHVLPQTFQRKHTIGGNAHENWCLLRLLPLMVGALVPVDEPVWQVVLNLKDIVELVVAPVHSAESVGYLECKISEHRKLYLEVFPGQNLLPKHHFLEHYPEMIKCFGPLVALWTMRFEAKHSFFKQIVRHTKNFRNITLSLAKKHQLMVSYHMLTSDAEKSPLETRHTFLPWIYLFWSILRFTAMAPNLPIPQFSYEVEVRWTRGPTALTLSSGTPLQSLSKTLIRSPKHLG